jgi:hypothetical protein
MSFERRPVWLWTLRPGEWSSIQISATDMARLQENYASTMEKFGSSVEFVESWTDSMPVDVWWVSGTEPYIDNLLGLNNASGLPCVVWRSSAGRRTPKATNDMRWYSVVHQNVGGVTNARGIFGASGLDDIAMPKDLPRTLAHVLQHSLRGIPCPPDLMDPHYTVHDRLSIGRAQPSRYSLKLMSRTGWCKRPLGDMEFAMAYELPDFLSWQPDFFSEIVPMQLFRAVMDAVLAQLNPVLAGRNLKRPKVMVPSGQMVTIDRHWLPTLARWIPGTWTDTPISDRAVKADNANIEFFPWHARIQSILPGVGVRDIATFERCLLRSWCLKLLRSFLAYLRVTYGANWVSCLAYARAKGSAPTPFPKRRRVEPLNMGGGGGDGGGDESSEAAFWLRQELLIDATKGRLVLAQVVESSWWEWSNGSALFFWRWIGKDQIRAARDGMEIFVASPPPSRSQLTDLFASLSFGSPIGGNQIGCYAWLTVARGGLC